MKRLKFAGRAVYHLMSRAVHQDFLLDEKGQEALRGIMRSQAAFCGVEVLTYCFMSNHFHILVRVDPGHPERLEDSELVARVTALYGSQRVPSLGVDAGDLGVLLAKGGARAESLRTRLRARMGDVSVFMKELKTRFSWWYNETFQTVGTFWAERFQSVLLEESSPAVAMVAAYIDLNPVRARITRDPADYRFCGFAEAAMGSGAARTGLACVLRQGMPDRTTVETYRRRILALAQKEATEEAPNEEGHLSLRGQVIAKVHALMKKGLALGSHEWIKRLRERMGCAFAQRGKAVPGLPAGVASFRQWVWSARRARDERKQT